MVSTVSNDIFRNKLPLLYVRGMVAVLIVPIVAVAIKKPSILQIFLVSNIFACASMPPILLGLDETYLYFLKGFEVVCAGLGGVFSVFLFGLVYYGGDARRAAELMILEEGLYSNDWSVFGELPPPPPTPRLENNETHDYKAYSLLPPWDL